MLIVLVMQLGLVQAQAMAKAPLPNRHREATGLNCNQRQSLVVEPEKVESSHLKESLMALEKAE
jgi:hypothetical protein